MAFLADRADGAIRRGVSMAESGARDRPFTLKRVKRFLGMTPRCRPVREWKYGDGWCSIFPWETQERHDNARRRDAVDEAKKRRRAACHARSFRRSFVVGAGRASGQLRAACAIWPLAHAHTPLAACLSACCAKSVDGRRCKRPPKGTLSVLLLVNGA